MTDNSDHFARLDFEVDAVENGSQFVVAEVDVGEFDVAFDRRHGYGISFVLDVVWSVHDFEHSVGGGKCSG